MINYKGYLALLIAVIGWATSSVSSKILQVESDPFQIVAYSFFIGPILLFLIEVVFSNKEMMVNIAEIKKGEWLYLIYAGLFQLMSIYLLHYVISMKLDIVIDIIKNSWPFFLVIFSRLFFREHSKSLMFDMTTITLAIIGVGLITISNSDSDSSMDHLVIYGITCVKASFGALHSLFYKKFTMGYKKKLPPRFHITTLTIRSMVGAITMIPFIAYYGVESLSISTSFTNIAVMSYTVIFLTILVHVMYGYAIEKLDAQTTATACCFISVFGIVFVSISNDEMINGIGLLGILLVFTANISRVLSDKKDDTTQKDEGNDEV